MTQVAQQVLTLSSSLSASSSLGASVSAGSVLHGIGSSLREAFFMFWETLWALILGFALSGAVQAFVPREALRAKLGNRRPRRGQGLGGGRALLVVLLCRLRDGQVTVRQGRRLRHVDDLHVRLDQPGGRAWNRARRADRLGVRSGRVRRRRHHDRAARAARRGLPERPLVQSARAKLDSAHARGTGHEHRTGHEQAATHDHATHDHATHDHSTHEAGTTTPWRTAVRTRAGWADAATYTVADLNMLRRELLIGFLGAGFLAVLVPVEFWHTFFIAGHGIWTSIENAVVGPFIALISFVCSIGNVPLAAALWKGGITFGGVISFIFADLIALPLVLIYRKFYGGRLALRMLAVFWGVMAAAGLVTELIFSAAGLIPATRPAEIVPERLTWNYTTILNIIFLVVFGLLFYLYRSRGKLGGGNGYAIDPVCGMQVEKSGAPARTATADGSYWFCSDRCCERFESNPARFDSRTTTVTGPG